MVRNGDLIRELEEIGAARRELVKRKNANYAGGDEDGNAFKNFDMIEELTNGKVTREIGLLVRMTDKLARLATLMTGTPDEVGESIDDTLNDLANYADLTLVARRDKAAEQAEEKLSADVKIHELEHAEQLELPFGAPEEYFLSTPTPEESPKSILARFFSRNAA